jgi:hypothetical protein
MVAPYSPLGELAHFPHEVGDRPWQFPATAGCGITEGCLLYREPRSPAVTVTATSLFRRRGRFDHPVTGMLKGPVIPEGKAGEG